MKKSTFYVAVYFAVLLVVAILTSCSTQTHLRKPNPCPQFGKSHPRDMPYTHPSWR
jgi:hypothetical protein